MSIFFEVHSGLPREAPGDPGSTERAYRLFPNLPARPRILEIACGPGATAVQLAQLSGGAVIALDLHPPFLGETARRAAEAGLSDRVHPLRQSMHALGLAAKSFDLIWSEGAIYIAGFEAGLRDLRRLLRRGGGLAVTEATWLRPDPPPEAAAFWNDAYPAMQDAAANLEAARRQGYLPLGHFTLPPTAWWEGYYRPMQARIAELRRKYAADPAALAELEAEQVEIDIYLRHGDSYGYVFYVLEKGE